MSQLNKESWISNGQRGSSEQESGVSNAQIVSAEPGVLGSLLIKGTQLNKESWISNGQRVSAEQGIRGLK